jgi:hypothetical protein
MRILNNDEDFLNILTNSNQNKNILRNISCLISWGSKPKVEKDPTMLQVYFIMKKRAISTLKVVICSFNNNK